MRMVMATTCLGCVVLMAGSFSMGGSMGVGVTLAAPSGDAGIIVSASEPDCAKVLDPVTRENIRSLQADVDKIIQYVTVTQKGETWKQLAEFVDRHGPRQAGSVHLERAIDDRIEMLSKINGVKKVVSENVTVPQWHRGDTEVLLLDAWSGGRSKRLNVLTLGYSVGTPNGGQPIVADAVVVRSFDELRAMPDQEVRGKVVVFNQPYVDYGTSVEYRSRGASEAAAKGGVAALIRSVTGRSLYTPHTGMMAYSDSDKIKVPAISVTVEDAELMWRKQQRGEKLRVSVRSTASQGPDVNSRNTVAQMDGSEKADEIVLVGGHIDSWDVGQGAMDDGGGAAISWRVPQVLSALGLRPRRSVHCVLFTSEEVGLIGGQAYFGRHKDQATSYQYVMESDYGTFTPLGLSTAVKNDQARCILRETLQLFSAINATQLLLSDDGPDVEQWFSLGVPGGSLYTANDRYFDFHHTDADMVSLMAPEDLDRATAVWTAAAYVLAQIDSRLPHDAPYQTSSHTLHS